ncbi:MAG: AAA family ATPase [Promethearchaeota archaeon]
MKLIELEIQNIRGIKQLKLKQEGKNFLIYGPNGSGKSAVVDAVDFLLTGQISRFKGEGTGSITLKKHGPHIEHQPDEAIVRGKIKLHGLEEPVEIIRCMNTPNKLEFDENARPYLDPVIELAKRGQFVLRRKQILNFITAQPANRADAIQTLLNIQEIETIRKKLVKIRNIFDKDIKAEKKHLDSSKGAINATTQAKSFNEETILEFINQNRALLNGDPVSNLKWSKLKEGIIIHTFIPTKEDNAINLIEKDIQNLFNVISDQKLQRFAALDEELRHLIKNIKQEPELIKDLDRLKLTEFGLRLLDETGNCPLCNAGWDRGELEVKFKQRIELSKQTKRIMNKIEEISDKLMEDINKTISSIEKIILLSEAPEIKLEIHFYQDWYNKLQKLRELVSDALNKYSESQFSQEMIRKMLAPDNVVESLQKILSIIKKKDPAISTEQYAWDNLTRLEEDLKIYENAKKKYLLAEINFEKADLLSDSFQQAKDNILTKLYEEIRDRFVELYKILHGNDENNFKAKIEPNKAGLNMEVDFHGYGTHPPHALHSEGHQDSMGICLYLTLAEKVNVNLMDLVILDDVIMSIDADHRRGICNILKKCFPNKQFFITSHNKTWTNQLKFERVIEPTKIIEFYNWNISTGPLSMDFEEDIWEPIEKNLEKNDVPSAASRLRRGLEQFFGSVCNDLCIPVIYKLNGRYELGDFLIPAINEYRSLLKKAISSAKSWDNEELFDSLKNIDSTRGPIFSRTYAEQWVINANVHYNNWANFSVNDIRPVVEAFQDLCLLFLCPSCGGMLYLTKHNFKPVNVRCNCGTVNWNLIKKVENL